MPLASGTRIGSYEIESLIGAGGMGEVYRARDHKLGRAVALKILSEGVAGDPDRLARFRREAQLLASLNHPNVAQIYGFEDAGPTQALVLELVEGPTLADRIAAGPIPVDEALAIARQIADAVASAHDSGIIHRDLKPANVKVGAASGAVKVLDFGLAKALMSETSDASPTSSPTLTARATQFGVILGTAAYMAPEQARGRAVDRRADLWAFGVVLYEMLTGRRAFDGSEVSDVLASVLKDTPPLDALPPGLPPSVRRLLRRTLEKDPARRLDSMAVARLELDDVESTPVVARDVRAPVRRVVIPAAMAAVISGVGIGAAVWYARQPTPPAVVRLALTPPADQPIGVEANHADVAITPDGSRVVYLTETGPARAFVVRKLDQAEGIVLNKLGEHVRGGFVSHDGRWLGYQAGPTGGRANEMRKVPIDGGAPLTVCGIDSNLRGASWGPDDTIVYATAQPASGLFRIPASGGKPEVLTTPDAAQGESDHLWPHHLPDGRHVLFAIDRQDMTWDVALLSLDTKTWRVILKGGMAPRYVSTGHLVYGSSAGIRGVAFDLDRLEVAGDPIELQSGVMTKESGAADFAVSNNGTLVYLPGDLRSSAATLAWMEPDGRETPVDQPPQEYLNLRLTRDGQRAIATIGRPDNSTLWLLDLARGLQIRLTPPDMIGTRPVWHPNGTEIVFWGAGRPGSGVTGGLFRVTVTGTGVPERLTTSDVPQSGSSWTPDGRLLFTEGTPGVDGDIKLLTFGSPPRVETLLGGPAVEVLPALSPDGRLLAYMHFDGTPQVFVRPFPNVNDARIPVSSGPGSYPEWSSDGRELYFTPRLTELLAARLESTNPISFSKPRLIKNLRDADSQQIRVGMPPVNGRLLRVVRAAPRSAGHTEYRVILNWTEEVRARIPSR